MSLKTAPNIVTNIKEVKNKLFLDFINTNDGFEDINSMDSISSVDNYSINKVDSHLDKQKQAITFYNFIQNNPFLITNSVNLPIKTFDFDLVKH